MIADKNVEAILTENDQRCSLWSVKNLRIRIAVAIALALAIEGLMRSNINMAMVCMVNRTALDLELAHSSMSTTTMMPMKANELDIVLMDNFTKNLEVQSTIISPRSVLINESKCGNISSKSEAKTNGNLVIPKWQQGYIFTSFYVGQLAIVMPGSYLCDWLGARNLVFIGAILNVVGSFITPYVASYWIHLIIVRFIMGCGQGVLVPCMNVLITHWFPLSEKSTAVAIATTGNQISVIVAMLLTAELCQFQWMGGWASAFYSYAFLGIFLLIIWWWFVADSPEEAKKITPNELRCIHEGEAKTPRKIDPKEIPWSKMMRSMVVWSIALCSFSQNFMNVGIIVYLPSYYHRYLKLDIHANGLMSALPFVFQLFTKIVFAGIADSLKSRKIMSHSAVAKLFNLIACIGSGICFLLLSFCGCDQKFWAITLAVLAIGLSSGFIPGYNTSIVCIAPRYTSSVASFSRLLGNIASVLSPYMLGYLGEREDWALAFWIIAIVAISTGILFQLCGSASVQSWANMPSINQPQKDDTVAFLGPNSSSTT